MAGRRPAPGACTAVILDLDGVLVDSEPLHLRATQAVLGPRGRSFTERDHRSFFGATDAEVLRVLRILLDLDVPSEALVARRRAHLRTLLPTARPRPGVPEVVHRLADRGFRLGLTSVSPRTAVTATLEATRLAAAFDAIVTVEDVERGAPWPDAFLLAARRLGTQPARCLAVEDSRNGVLAARAAGMPVAAIPCPATSDEDFSLADLVLPSLEGLLKVWEDRPAGDPG